MTPEELHDNSIVVDLHCHPAIKASIFHRDLGSRKEKFLPSLFKRSFWPLANRASFPKVSDGGVDVLLSTAYVPEGGWYKDMALAKWLLLFAPKVRKKIYESSYYEAVSALLDDVEEQAKAWNLNAENKRKIVHCTKPDMILDAVKTNSIALIHSVEGAHSIQGTSAKDYPDDIRRGLGARAGMFTKLDELNDRGVAYLTLAHFYPNECVNPVFPWPEYAFDHGDWEKLLSKWDETKGLTPRGVFVVERMLELGMLIDISHSGES
jgi:microsomal dipeptidase-like Zn-dependent dipeptidase